MHVFPFTHFSNSNIHFHVPWALQLKHAMLDIQCLSQLLAQLTILLLLS